MKPLTSSTTAESLKERNTKLRAAIAGGLGIDILNDKKLLAQFAAYAFTEDRIQWERYSLDDLDWLLNLNNTIDLFFAQHYNSESEADAVERMGWLYESPSINKAELLHQINLVGKSLAAVAYSELNPERKKYITLLLK